MERRAARSCFPSAMWLPEYRPDVNESATLIVAPTA
jgi:hypothetical protein